MATTGRVLSLFVALLQACLVCSLQGQSGQAVSTNANFQAFSSLLSLKCNGKDVVGTGGRSADLLDTDAKLDAFAATLTSEQRSFFALIRASPDHSFASFTEDEARVTFLFLFSYLNAEGKVYYLSVRSDFDNVPYTSILEAVQNWHPDVHLLMTEKAQCEVLGKMNETLLTAFCSKFIDSDVSAASFSTTVNRCSYCAALGVEKRRDDSVIGALSKPKCDVYIRKVRQFKSSGWDVYYMTWCPQSITAEDTDRIADFCNSIKGDNNQQTRLAENRFTTKLQPVVLRKLGRMLVNCFGQLNTWTTDQIRSYAAYVAHMPRNLLKEMTVSQLATNLNVLVAVPDVQKTEIFRVLGFKIASWWQANSGSFDADTQNKIICIAVKYAPDKSFLQTILTKAQLQTAVSKFESLCSGFAAITPDEAKTVLNEVVPAAGFAWTSQTLDILGKYIGRLPLGVIKAVPANVICTNWQNINTADMGRAELFTIWKKCKDTFGDVATYNCTTLRSLGMLLRVLPDRFVRQIGNDVWAECLQHIAEPFLDGACSRRRGTCKIIMRKIKVFAASNSQKFSTYFMQVGRSLGRAVSDYSNINLADLGGTSNINSLNIDFLENKAATKSLWKKVKAALGEVTHDNTQYCATNFAKISKIFIAAATDKEWEKLCEDTHVFESIAEAGAMVQRLGGKQIRAIVKKLMRLFGITGNVNAVCVDGPLIEQVAIFLPYAKGEDLAKLSKATLKHVMRVIGSTEGAVRRITRGMMKFLTQVAVKTEAVLTSIGVETLDATGTGAWCGITVDDVNKFSDDAIRMYGIELLVKCEQLDFETNTALAKRVAALTITIGASVIEEYGEKFMYILKELSTDQINGLKEQISSVVERLMKKLTESTERLKKKDNREVATTERDQIRTLRIETTGQLFTLVLEVKAGSARKKRATASADCSTLATFAGNMDFMTTTQINSIAPAEVKNCLAQLSTTVWNTEQCSAWKAHLTHADGLNTPVSSWTTSDIQALGYLVDCLTSAEVQSLPVDDDVIQGLSTFVLTNAADVMTAYIATTGVSISSLDEDKLSDMGNMMCGFTSTQIGDMPQAAVHASSKDLSTLECMDSTQLVAVANKIVAVEGTDWATKDAELVEEFGVFISGLNQTVLSTFTNDQVKAITPAAIAKIPPTTLANSFSAEALAGLSTEQSNAITTEQLNQLSAEQKKNVEDNTSYNVPTSVLSILDFGSGVSCLHTDLFRLLTVVMSGMILAVLM